MTGGAEYRYFVQASDADGEQLSYSLTQAPTAMAIDSLGRITWATSPSDVGMQAVEVTVTDERGLAAVQAFDLNVTADVTAPQVAILPSNNPVEIGSTVTVVVQAVDDLSVAEVRLTVEGETVLLDAQNRANVVASEIGPWAFAAEAVDGSGNVGNTSIELFVVDPNDVDAPQITIASPADNATLTAPTDLIGSVTDDNLAFYTVSVAPIGGNFIEVARETSPVVDSVVGQIDPSVLENGNYTVRIEAQDLAGRIARLDQRFEATGELKLGNFSLSFSDLSIPVSGVPITVTRTYDSFTAAEQDDLGYGWRMEILDTDLRTNVPRTGLEEDFIYNAFFQGARVYVRVPGEGRIGFTFEPQLTNSFLGLYAPRFVTEAGEYASLTVPDANLRPTTDGSFIDWSTGLPYNPASPAFGGQYTLTTKEGLRFEIDGDTGDTRRIIDRNSNSLTFNDDGIVSSTGKSVEFERDPQGRIAAVIDPNGQRVEYTYDAAGDLVSVTDREGNVTQYVYDEPLREHYLTEVIDPLGRTGLRSEFDELGRLVRMIDADGQEIELTHEPGSFTETVRDQLGNATVFTYDSEGNVTREINAEGDTMLRTYDAVGNTLSETMVLGEDDNTTNNPDDPTDLITSYTYDSRGNTLTETDGLGNTTRFSYDSFGNVLTTTDPLGNTSTNRYDSKGNLTSITDASGQATDFSYDSAGNPSSISLPGSSAQTFVYDSAGNVTQQTDALGDITTFTYDANGNQLMETRTQTLADGSTRAIVTESEYDAESRLRFSRFFEDGVLQRESETQYDAVGNRVTEIDLLGRVTKFVHDDRGLLTETVLPDDTPDDDSDNPRTKTVYDNAGQTIATIDELGRRTEFIYDKAGRQQFTIFPDATPLDNTDNPRTGTVYDEAGRTVARIDERGNRTKFVYDDAGRQIEVILPDDTPLDDSDNPRSRTAYDEAGRSIAQIDPLGNETQFRYDATGRPEQTIFADGTSTESVFDDAGRLSARIDQNGLRTDYVYDDLGRLTAVIQPAVPNPDTGLNEQPRTEYEYDDLGNLVVQRDALGRETRYEYDGQGRRTSTILPLGQSSLTTYDAVGNVLTMTDFNDDTITYDYDARNRLIEKRFPDGSSVSMTYTDNGLRKSVTDERGVTSYAYDERDRLVSRTDPDTAEISYTYDAAGNRTSVTTALAGSTTYTFDAQNRLETVTDPDSDVTTYSYDAVSNLINVQFPNTTAETREYDSLNRLTFLENRGPSGVINSFRYTLDDSGNRTAVEEADGRRVDYVYDDHHRLTSEQITDAANGNRQSDYEYDLVGNRLTRDDSLEGTTTYAYDDNDRLMLETLASESTQYEYDDNGNTLSKTTNATDSVFYDWDFENRLVAVDTDGDGTFDVRNHYDVDGIRVAQTVDGNETRFLIDKNRPYAQVLEEYTPGGILLASYVHGHDLISQNRSSVKSFYHVDGLGSTRALSDVNGLITDSYLYDAFGRRIGGFGGSVNPFLYTGEYRDSVSGLDYLRARWMDSGVGRFVSRDRFEGLRTNPVTLNPYLYAGSNPVVFIDPSGYLQEYSINGQLAVLGVLAIVTGIGITTLSRPAANAKLFSDGVSKLSRLFNLAVAAVAEAIDDYTEQDEALIELTEEKNKPIGYLPQSSSNNEDSQESCSQVISRIHNESSDIDNPISTENPNRWKFGSFGGLYGDFGRILITPDASEAFADPNQGQPSLICGGINGSQSATAFFRSGSSGIAINGRSYNNLPTLTMTGPQQFKVRYIP